MFVLLNLLFSFGAGLYLIVTDDSVDKSVDRLEFQALIFMVFADFISVFLTILLLNRAKRDEDKCLAKYGDGYKELMRLVPYRVVPGVY